MEFTASCLGECATAVCMRGGGWGSGFGRARGGYIMWSLHAWKMLGVFYSSGVYGVFFGDNLETAARLFSGVCRNNGVLSFLTAFRYLFMFVY